MIKGCDEVVDAINLLFGTQEEVKTSPRKPQVDSDIER